MPTEKQDIERFINELATDVLGEMMIVGTHGPFGIELDQVTVHDYTDDPEQPESFRIILEGSDGGNMYVQEAISEPFTKAQREDGRFEDLTLELIRSGVFGLYPS